MFSIWIKGLGFMFTWYVFYVLIMYSLKLLWISTKWTRVSWSFSCTHHSNFSSECCSGFYLCCFDLSAASAINVYYSYYTRYGRCVSVCIIWWWFKSDLSVWSHCSHQISSIVLAWKYKCKASWATTRLNLIVFFMQLKQLRDCI